MPGIPRAARAATSIVFAVNAFAYANVIPRLPAVRDGIGLTDGALGAAVAGAAAGALVASLSSGFLVHRFGSARTTLAFGLLLCAASVLPGVAPVWLALAGAFVLVGVGDAVMDVAMNAQGFIVQEAYGRSVLNSFHGWWSIGSAAGALTGSLAAALDVPLGWHLLGTAAAGTAALTAAARFLLPDPHHAAGADPEATRRPAFAVLGRALAPVVVVAALATFVEDSPATWSAIYLRDWLDTTAGVAGLGFVAFATGMTVGRLVADRLVDRFGPAPVTRAGALAASGALAVVLVADSVWVALPGFVVAGLGVAPQFPAMFTAAATRPGVPAAHGLAVASWAARSGFLVAPVLVGLLSDAFGLPRALWVVVAAGLFLAIAVRALRTT